MGDGREGGKGKGYWTVPVSFCSIGTLYTGNEYYAWEGVAGDWVVNFIFLVLFVWSVMYVREKKMVVFDPLLVTRSFV